LFERRKRSSRDHEEWGKIKSMILLELMKGPDTRSGLKLKLNEQLKREGDLPISIKTIVRHLRDPNKKGLIDKKIVRERKGLLELSLSNPEEIAKFIDELSKNKTMGPRVSYFIDRAFAEAFLSPFGDRFSNYERINKVIYAGIHNIYPDPGLKQYEENVRYTLITILEQRVVPPDVDILNRIDPPGRLPFYLDNENEVELDEETREKAIELANKSDLLSIIIRASKEIRGETDTFFKVCYILDVLDRVHLLHRAKVDSSIRGLINTLDLTMFHMTSEEIEKINPTSEILKEFKELLFKAINGLFYEDRSFNDKYAILDLNRKNPDESIALSSAENSLSREMSDALFASLIGDGPTSVPKKGVKLLKERWKKGLSSRLFTFY